MVPKSSIDQSVAVRCGVTVWVLPESTNEEVLGVAWMLAGRSAIRGCGGGGSQSRRAGERVTAAHATCGNRETRNDTAVRASVRARQHHCLALFVRARSTLSAEHLSKDYVQNNNGTDKDHMIDSRRLEQTRQQYRVSHTRICKRDVTIVPRFVKRYDVTYFQAKAKARFSECINERALLYFSTAY